MSFYIYIAECRDGSYYCGYTDDVSRRIKAHNDGRGAKYTKSRRPVRLVYSEEFADKSSALKRESFIKKLTRAQKEALVNGDKKAESSK